jgi:formylglycine-generating enzyme required for sulfatase activity
VKRWVLLGLVGLAPVALAQTQSRDDGTEQGEPMPSASVSAVPPPLVSRRSIIQKDGMVFVHGGRFTMGSNGPKAAPNEKPAHAATVDSFWIDRTEVTVGAYRACVASGKCDAPQKSSRYCTWDMGDDGLPVSCVRWQDADEYCRYANKRLPTETEWELAARGGGAYKFPWGNFRISCAVAATLLNNSTARSCSGTRPARVGHYAANVSPFGAMDMAGNVEEWTSSWYVEHTASGARPRAGASHVLRGGGWLSRPVDCRTTSRDWGSSMEAGPNVGFRCAKD